MTWAPKGGEFKFDMPQLPTMPDLPDFDVPVSVVIVHSSLRSGLMVENITPQLGEFFGVKGGNGVLVRSVEKGSRGEKAGFRAGDVVVKVNNQPVHDTSDFTHALRSSSGGAAAVTVMREKREQNLTLTLPEKKDSGSLLEDSFDVPDSTAETEQAINRAEEKIARLGPAIMEKAQRTLRTRDKDLRDIDKRLQGLQRKMEERQQEMQERQQKLLHELSGGWAEI
jgi:membrane-associated protease RseP (regulator of RpoE activity)